MPNPIFHEMRVLVAAIKQNPALGYALGVAGVAAAVGISLSFLAVDVEKAMWIILVFLGLMVLLFLFTIVVTLPSKAFRAPAMVLLWFTVVLVIAGMSVVGLGAVGLGPLQSLLPAGSDVHKVELGPELEAVSREQSTPRRKPQKPQDAMVLIEGGEFKTGDKDGATYATLAPDTHVNDFWLDRTEVTVDAYRGCVLAEVCSVPNSYQKENGQKLIFCNWNHPQGRGSHPVNCVTWKQAKQYCEWQEKRLPTEEEWEFAASSRGKAKYPWGKEPLGPLRVNGCDKKCVERLRDAGFDGWNALAWDDGYAETAPVGEFPDGESEQGVSDLAGNVWEWTSGNGWSVRDKCESRKECKATRGGSWSSDSKTSSRFLAASRLGFDMSYREASVGFRCARSN